MADAWRRHWPEYLIEAFALGAFMVSACAFGALLWHPGSPLAPLVPDGLPRRALMGAAMGLTAVALIYSPWGQRSGAHMNPAVTLTFVRLGKAKAEDGVFYVLAQFTGGLAGVLLSAALLGSWLSHPAVHFVVTAPHAGEAVALVAETSIAFLMMGVVLALSNSRFAASTGIGAGLLVASYITFEEPFSGMSLNPARTLASAIPAGDFTGLWVYLLAPPLGMLLAAEAFVWGRGRNAARCAKLHHTERYRCLFCQGG